MTSRRDIARQAEDRAGGRCEYCRMHQSLQGATFHLEHVVPHSRGGDAQLDNLAWACPSCNLHKSNRVESVDPETRGPGMARARQHNSRSRVTPSWSLGLAPKALPFELLPPILPLATERDPEGQGDELQVQPETLPLDIAERQQNTRWSNITGSVLHCSRQAAMLS